MLRRRACGLLLPGWANGFPVHECGRGQSFSQEESSFHFFRASNNPGNIWVVRGDANDGPPGKTFGLEKIDKN